MVIKGIEIGTGKPCVCVPVMGKTRAEIVEEVIALAGTKADIIEWRVDAFSEYRNYNAIREVLDEIKPYLSEKIFLYTFRTKAQGGMGIVSAEELEDIHELAAESDCVDLLDLEYFEEEYPIIKIRRLQEMGVKIVASHHDFEETPEREVMKMLL